MPFIATLALLFSELEIDLSLKCLKADVLNLPIIHSWMCKTIAQVLTAKPIIVQLMSEEQMEKGISSQSTTVHPSSLPECQGEGKDSKEVLPSYGRTWVWCR